MEKKNIEKWIFQLIYQAFEIILDYMYNQKVLTHKELVSTKEF